MEQEKIHESNTLYLAIHTLIEPASFYKGKESPYEIYNSVMVDVYVNLIHGLVEQIDYTNSDDLLSSASSFEFMDLRNIYEP